MSEPWRWLDSRQDLSSSHRNMDIDRAILESYIAGESLQTVRIYQWAGSFVTYGRLQDKRVVTSSYPGAKLLQRPTGGRAVEHGDDLTVTVVCNEVSLKSINDGSGVLSSYRTILAGLVDTIVEYGVSAATGTAREVAQSEDCFASVGKCDVVDRHSGEKIVGSAQLRSRGAVIQQMSIRPHSRYHIETQEFVDSLRRHMTRHLNVRNWTVTDRLTQSELAHIGRH